MLLETVRPVRTELIIVNLSQALKVCMFFWIIACHFFQYNSYSVFALSISPSIKDLHYISFLGKTAMLGTCLPWKWTRSTQSSLSHTPHPPLLFLTAGYFPFCPFLFLEEITPAAQHDCNHAPATLIPSLLSCWRNRNTPDTSERKDRRKN